MDLEIKQKIQQAEALYKAVIRIRNFVEVQMGVPLSQRHFDETLTTYTNVAPGDSMDLKICGELQKVLKHVPERDLPEIKSLSKAFYCLHEERTQTNNKVSDFVAPINQNDEIQKELLKAFDDLKLSLR